MIVALLVFPIASIHAGIAFSEKSTQSLSITSNRTENSNHYLLEIEIEGVSVSKVTFEANSQSLYLSAKSGGVFSNSRNGGAIAGAQVIRFVFTFPPDANLEDYMRINSLNKIMIHVPKL